MKARSQINLHPGIGAKGGNCPARLTSQNLRDLKPRQVEFWDKQWPRITWIERQKRNKNLFCLCIGGAEGKGGQEWFPSLGAKRGAP